MPPTTFTGGGSGAQQESYSARPSSTWDPFTGDPADEGRRWLDLIRRPDAGDASGAAAMALT
jgi:hypothetical protein